MVLYNWFLFPTLFDIGFFRLWWLFYHILDLPWKRFFQVKLYAFMICERWNPLVNLFILLCFIIIFSSWVLFIIFFMGIILFYFFPKHFLFSGAYRYLRPLVADVAVVAKCHLSALYKHEKGKLFAQLVDLLQFYEKFEINDHVGTQLTDDEVLQSHYDRFQSFQLLAFKKIPKVHVSAGIYKCSELKNLAAYDVNIKEQLFVIIIIIVITIIALIIV